MEETPIKNLIAEWPTRKVFAQEVGASVHQVHKWAENGRVPSRWQASVIAAAQSRGLEHVTADWMVRVHSDRSAA